jgi:hypothetical protein
MARFERLRKVNNFVGERLQLSMDTAIDITKAVTESFEPLKKHSPDVIVRFLQGQKQLFEKRRAIRERAMS